MTPGHAAALFLYMYYMVLYLWYDVMMADDAPFVRNLHLTRYSHFRRLDPSPSTYALLTYYLVYYYYYYYYYY